MKFTLVVVLLACAVAVNSQLVPGAPFAPSLAGIPGFPLMPPIVPGFLAIPHFRPLFGARRIFGFGGWFGKRDVSEVEAASKVQGDDKKVEFARLQSDDKKVEDQRDVNTLVKNKLDDADIDDAKKVDTQRDTNKIDGVDGEDKKKVDSVDGVDGDDKKKVDSVDGEDKKKVETRDIPTSAMARLLAGKRDVNAVNNAVDNADGHLSDPVLQLAARSESVSEPITQCVVSSVSNDLKCVGLNSTFVCKLRPQIDSLGAIQLKLNDLDIIRRESNVDVLRLITPKTKITAVHPRTHDDVIISLWRGEKPKAVGFEILDSDCWTNIALLVGNMRPEELHASLILNQ